MFSALGCATVRRWIILIAIKRLAVGSFPPLNSMPGRMLVADILIRSAFMLNPMGVAFGLPGRLAVFLSVRKLRGTGLLLRKVVLKRGVFPFIARGRPIVVSPSGRWFDVLLLIILFLIGGTSPSGIRFAFLLLILRFLMIRASPLRTLACICLGIDISMFCIIPPTLVGIWRPSTPNRSTLGLVFIFRVSLVGPTWWRIVGSRRNSIVAISIGPLSLLCPWEISKLAFQLANKVINLFA